MPQLIPAAFGAVSSIGAGLSTAAPYIGAASASGILDNLFGRKSSGGSGGGAEVITLPQYSFTEPRLRLISDFVSDQLSRIGQGKFPAYYEKAVPYIRSELERGRDLTYYGRPGDRYGAMHQAYEQGAILGTGPKATVAQTKKVQQRYEDASKAIDEFIQKEGLDVTQEAIRTSIYGGLSIPSGPPSQVVSYGGYGPQVSSGITDSASAIARLLPQLFGEKTMSTDEAIASMSGDLTTGLDPLTAWGGVPSQPSQPAYYPTSTSPTRYSSSFGGGDFISELMRKAINMGTNVGLGWLNNSNRFSVPSYLDYIYGGVA